MSNNSKKLLAKKKKDGWQEAGAEFYQESYPSGSGQGNESEATHHHQSIRPLRNGIPLPSLTARRNSSYAYSRNRRNRTIGRTAQENTHNAYTLTSFGINTTTNDVHISALPDLSDIDMTLPTEVKRWEELNKIKRMPINMAAKRELKAQLTNIPMLKLRGTSRLKFYTQRFFHAIVKEVKHSLNTPYFWRTSLQNIEVRCGTSIVNVFLFIKWTCLFNLMIFLIVLIAVIMPQFFANEKPLNSNQMCPTSNYTDQSSVTWSSDNKTRNIQTGECCHELYHTVSDEDTHGKHGFWKGISAFVNKQDISQSLLVYGFYDNTDLALSYAAVPFGIFLICLGLMVYQVALGIKDITLAKEGEFYKFSNLVFAGWDHYTKDEAGAKFKRKILKHEMKLALKSEKLKVVVIPKKERIRRLVIRIITNLLMLAIFGLVSWTVFEATSFSIKQVQEAKKVKKTHTHHAKLQLLFFRILPSLTIISINTLFPILLKHISRLEKFPQEVKTTLTLFRTLIVRLLSIAVTAIKYYSLSYCAKEDTKCQKCKEPLRDTDTIALCWESKFAEEIYLIIVVDLAVKILLTILNSIRFLMKRYIPCKLCSMLGTMKFSIVRHSLDIVYIQSLAWFTYFGPLLPLVAFFYCFIIFYVKKYTVLVTCQAVPDTFRSSRTTTLFVATKLISFLVISMAIGFVYTFMEPSRSCGPFRHLSSTWEALSGYISTEARSVIDLFLSPGFTTPLIILLVVVAYYYYSVAVTNRATVETLRHLLILEGHDKQYLFARLNSMRKPSTSSIQTGRTGTTATANND